MVSSKHRNVEGNIEHVSLKDSTPSKGEIDWSARCQWSLKEEDKASLQDEQIESDAWNWENERSENENWSWETAVDDDVEASLEDLPLNLVGGPLDVEGERGRSTPSGPWKYVVFDVQRRSFAGHLQGALSDERQRHYFDRICRETDWLQQEDTPRKTTWFVRDGCTCKYAYSGIEVLPQRWPGWMEEILASVMPLCGKTRADWPNSCNVNLYGDGSHTLGWHADDEPLFQGKLVDCCIISLSLGQARSFEMYGLAPSKEASPTHVSLELGGGDLCTMEGMFQKHYWHRVPYREGELGPRINLTWRWIRQHDLECPKIA